MRNARPTPRRLAPLAAVSALLVSPLPVQGQVDPYGPRPQAAPAPSRDLSRVTPLLRVEDGTPRYALVPEGSLARSDAMNSQMLAFSLQDFLPVDAGRNSPLSTGAHGGTPVVFHYIVKFWDQYPNAKDRPGHTERLGETNFTIQQTTPLTPPPAIKLVLDAQAERMRDAVQAYPFIQRSADTLTRVTIRYHRDKDPSGTEVWGFNLAFGFGAGGSIRPERLPSGRWRWTSHDWFSLDICSNCFAELKLPNGRYRGMQSMGHDVLVDTLAAPLWVSEYRSGDGPLIPNPELYDRARPATDIQILTVSPPHWIGVAAAEGPDQIVPRMIAAAWLTDWKMLVNQANSPAAPKAD